MNQFLQLVYSSPGRAGLFLYTSDLAVLVAVLVRSVVDRPLSDPVFLVYFSICPRSTLRVVSSYLVVATGVSANTGTHLCKQRLSHLVAHC